MTLEEKILQLQAGNPNAALRLDVPDLHMGEALHGVITPGATCFPAAIALGSTWDTNLIEQVGGAIAIEARAVGMQQEFGPMLGLAQDARWGRVEESYGEDPFLVSRLGVACIDGLQGTGTNRFDCNHIIATAKHFAADGQPLAGENGGAMEISERTLRETHLMPFEAAVKEARVGAIMPAHHAINGTPCHANFWLLNDVLRKEWGFDGFVVSDFGDLYNLVADDKNSIAQRVVAKPVDAARLALESGVDSELSSGDWNSAHRVFAKTLLDAVQSGSVPMDLVDRATARVLRAKLELGLQTKPSGKNSSTLATNQLAQAEDDSAGDLWGSLVLKGQLAGPTEGRRADADKILNDPAHDALALKAAQEAVVLLKNQNGLLPLAREKFKNIVVAGPLAAETDLGGYSTSKPKFYVNVVDGLKNIFGDGTKIIFSRGCELTNDSTALLASAVAAAREADVVVAVVGTTRRQLGENLDRDNLDLVGGQEKLVEALQATGKPVVVVLLNGGPLDVGWIKRNVPAIVEGWYLGQATGTALAQVLVGDVNPGGKLAMTFPQNAGRCPDYYYRPSAARRMNYYDSHGGDLFAFGYGLSYTTFKLDDLKISPEKISTNETAMVNFRITNTGSRAGDEVVQLYLRDDVSSLVRPAKELRGFTRVALAPGESRMVSFPVGFPQLKFWKDGWTVEPGTFTAYLGVSSEDIRLKGTIEVVP